MKIGIAPDSFKGSLTAAEAADCIEAGFLRVFPRARCEKIPMADGGEGTVSAMVAATDGRMLKRRVHDPLGRMITASFGVTGDGSTAVIEMAAASGLALLKPKERNPLVTTTRGTGELIKRALDSGVEKILIGIGGSATNDGGAGMARALGARFLDSRGRDLPEGGGALGSLRRIDVSRMDDRLKNVSVEVACDVDNPLTGPRGAAAVYGPQKGATPAMVKKLDAGLANLASVVKRDLGEDILRVPGSGAAGGLGGGLMAFVGGSLRPGVHMVMEAVGLHRRLVGCDYVITGEGRMDFQTAFGKTPAGVAAAAKQLGIPVIAISGSLGDDVSNINKIGIEAFFSALKEPVEEEDLPKLGPRMLTECSEQAARLLALGLKGSSSSGNARKKTKRRPSKGTKHV